MMKLMKRFTLAAVVCGFFTLTSCGGGESHSEGAAQEETHADDAHAGHDHAAEESHEGHDHSSHEGHEHPEGEEHPSSEHPN